MQGPVPSRLRAISAASPRLLPYALACAGLLVALPAAAERLAEPLQQQARTALRGSVAPQVRQGTQGSRLDSSAVLHGVSLYFRLSSAQQQDLDALLQRQRDPSSSDYHAWLTPAQYRDRFGMEQADLAKVESWLQNQGLIVDSIGRSANRISFSGSVAQIEAALGTQMREYRVGGETHYANAAALQLPAALADVTAGLRNLSDFRPRARAVRSRVRPRFTSSISGSHYLAPQDFATIYGLQSLYSGGVTGSGRKIAVVGQSAVKDADLNAFRSAAGLSSKLPDFILVPHSGLSTVQSSSGDEVESDLDLEWSGAVARDAQIEFVYTGASSNYSVFDALVYAIENDTAPVISVSYGDCEADYASSDIDTLEGYLKEANAQGQTVVVAAGDTGAADCDYSSGSTPVTSATHGLAVDYPASSVYATAVGGTTLSEGSGSYWSASNDSYAGSALSYIPEVVWNDTSSTDGLTAAGGGKSILFAKPSWQSGDGVPADGVRDLPDVSFAASADHDGYLYCSEGSCSSGFRDANEDLTVAGGTSLGAPGFSAMLTLVAQHTGDSALGNVGSRLYTLAVSGSGVFHDITSGNNEVPCTRGTTDCASGGDIGYSAGTGYDLASGLGSVDGYNLADQWTATSSSSSSGSSGSSSSSSSSSGSSSGSGSSSSSSGSGKSSGSGGGAVDPALGAVLGLMLLRRRRAAARVTFVKPE